MKGSINSLFILSKEICESHLYKKLTRISLKNNKNNKFHMFLFLLDIHTSHYTDHLFLDCFYIFLYIYIRTRIELRVMHCSYTTYDRFCFFFTMRWRVLCTSYFISICTMMYYFFVCGANIIILDKRKKRRKYVTKNIMTNFSYLEWLLLTKLNMIHDLNRI
jgi:hypothetical protein